MEATFERRPDEVLGLWADAIPDFEEQWPHFYLIVEGPNEVLVSLELKVDRRWNLDKAAATLLSQMRAKLCEVESHFKAMGLLYRKAA